MDDADRAAEREEMARTSALYTCRKPEGPAPTGSCLWCGERLPLDMRWCDADCRTPWQEEQRLKGRR